MTILLRALKSVCIILSSTDQNLKSQIDSFKIPVPAQYFFIPLAGGFHIAHSLVINNMVYLFKIGRRYNLVKGFFQGMRHEMGQEGSIVVHPLDKGMDSIIESLDGGYNNAPVFVFQLSNGSDLHRTLGNAVVEGLSTVLNLN